MTLDPDGNPYNHNEEQNEAAKRDSFGSLQAPSQFRKEVLAIVRRYGQESDLTIYQALGALEVVKADLLDMLNQGADGL